MDPIRSEQDQQHQQGVQIHDSVAKLKYEIQLPACNQSFLAKHRVSVFLLLLALMDYFVGHRKPSDSFLLPAARIVNLAMSPLIPYHLIYERDLNSLNTNEKRNFSRTARAN